MSTEANAVIPGVVAMSAREVKALRDRVADLEAENATLSAHVCTHGQSSDRGAWLCPITVIEKAASGKYWQIAKGKVRSGEPLFGAAIIDPGTNKIIALGEADDMVTAIRNLKPATEK